MIEIICKTCGKKRKYFPWVIKKGFGKFCCLSCAVKSITKKVSRKCLLCNKKFLVKRYKVKEGHGKFCSNSCSTKFRWGKNGRKSQRGYTLILLPSHPKKDRSGYVREHRIIIENILGRLLQSNEQVHHVNGNKSDNRIKNLIVLNSNSAHMRYHNSPKKVKSNEIIFNGENY